MNIIKINKSKDDFNKNIIAKKKHLEKIKSDYVKTLNKDIEKEEKTFKKQYTKYIKDYGIACKLGEDSPAAVMLKTIMERADKNHKDNINSIHFSYKHKMDAVEKILNNLTENI